MRPGRHPWPCCPAIFSWRRESLSLCGQIRVLLPIGDVEAYGATTAAAATIKIVDAGMEL